MLVFFYWYSVLFVTLLLIPFQDSSVESKQEKEGKLPSAKKIINKYVIALGGYEVLESRENKHWQSSGRTSQGETFTVEAWQAEGKYAVRFERGNGTFYTRGVWTDGNKDSNGHRKGFAWQQNDGGNAVEKQDAELQEYLRRRTYVSSVPTWFEDYKSVKCVGVEFVHDKETYQVQLIDHDETVIDLYFDAKTGLLVRRVSVEAFNNTVQRVVRDRFDFEEVGETIIAKKETISWNNIVYVYENELVDFNIRIPKDTFKAPSEIQKKIDVYLNSKQEKTLAKMPKAEEPKPKLTKMPKIEETKAKKK